MNFRIILFLALWFVPDVAFAVEPVVAVFPMEDTSRRKRKLVESLTDYLRVKLAEAGRVRVVDKTEQERQLKRLISREKKNSYRTCVDESCQIPLGKELAADRILRSKITRFGKSYVVSAEVVDLRTESTAGAASAKSDGTPEGLMMAVEALAADLQDVIAVGEAPPPPPPVVDTAPPPPSVVQAPAVKMVKPPMTGLEKALIFGGWATFGAAYIGEVIFTLTRDNVANIYYAFFPFLGPIFNAQFDLNTGLPPSGTDKAIHYGIFGAQVLGAGTAAVGHFLVETKEKVREDTGLPQVTLLPGPGGVQVLGRF